MADLTPEAERALMKRWVDQWKITGPELERLKRQELRALPPVALTQRAIAVMNSRPRHASDSPKLRRVSGLVEQQKLFAKARATLR